MLERRLLFLIFFVLVFYFYVLYHLDTIYSLFFLYIYYKYDIFCIKKLFCKLFISQCNFSITILSFVLKSYTVKIFLHNIFWFFFKFIVRVKCLFAWHARDVCDLIVKFVEINLSKKIYKKYILGWVCLYLLE